MHNIFTFVLKQQIIFIEILRVRKNFLYLSTYSPYPAFSLPVSKLRFPLLPFSSSQ